MGEGKAGQGFAGDVHRGKISAPGGTVVDVELRLSPDQGRVGLEYRLTPQADIGLNSLHVSLGLPARHWAGGSCTADRRSGALQTQFDKAGLHSAAMKSLHLAGNDGAAMAIDFPEPTQVLIQDDRQWGESFSVRIGPPLGNGETWSAGKSLRLVFSLTGGEACAWRRIGPSPWKPVQAGCPWT